MNRRRTIVLLGIVALLGVMAWRLRQPQIDGSGHFPAISPSVPKTSAPPSSSIPSTTPKNAMPVLMPTSSAEEIVRVLEQNIGPLRIVFLEFQMADHNLRLLRAVGAAGRAKPGPLHSGPGFIQYEVFDLAGRLTHSGSVVDPTHERVEYPDSTDPTVIKRTYVDRPQATLSVRLPGESTPARIVFFRVHDSPFPTQVSREVIGDFTLRSSAR